MCVSSASPPNFQECREPSLLMVSAACSRCSRVSLGKMVDRPKPSIIPGIRVSGKLELLSDHCMSREYCRRRWLISRQERALVSDAVAVSVATCSTPLSEMPHSCDRA